MSGSPFFFVPAALCFDVIFANPRLGLSGQWRALPDDGLIHEECFAKRLAWLRANTEARDIHRLC